MTSLRLGDSNPLQSRHMCAMFGEYLESDMVQLAHHGNSGCEKHLYTLVNAKVLRFPVDNRRVERFVFSTQHPTLHDVNLHALTLPRMQYVFVSGNNNTISNDCNICLLFGTVTGQPDCDAICDAVKGEKYPTITCPRTIAWIACCKQNKTKGSGFSAAFGFKYSS